MFLCAAVSCRCWMTRLCRDRNETVAALAVALVPGTVPTASTSAGAAVANVATQAEASTIMARRRKYIHASKPKCPLLRTGNRSSSNAAAFKPIRSACSNGAAHCAATTGHHRQPSQAKRLSGSECRSEHVHLRARRSAAPAQNSANALFTGLLCSSISLLHLQDRNPRAWLTRYAPDRSGRTDWPDAPGRCCPGCRPSRTGAPYAC